MAEERPVESTSPDSPQSDVVTWRADAGTLQVRAVNDKAERVVGLPLSRWLSDARFLAEHLDPRDRERTLAGFRAVATDGRERQFVHRFLTADGQAHWFRTRVRRLEGNDGPELVGVQQAVAAPSQAEEANRRSVVELRRGLAQLPAFVFVTDEALRFTATAGATLLDLGLSGSLEGLTLSDLSGSDTRQHPDLVAHRRALAGEPVQYEAQWFGRWFDVRVNPILDAEGRAVGTTGVAVDITERHHQSQKLEQSEQQLRSVFEASPDPIFLKDGRGRWLFANDAALRLFQLEGQDYTGKTDADLSSCTEFYKDALLTCVDTDERTWRSREVHRGVEIVPRPDGSLQYFDVVKVPIFNPDGSRKSFAVISQNATEKRRAQMERDALWEQDQKARRNAEFLSAASRSLASTLDYEACGAVVAGLGAPFLGEWCAVDVLDDEGRIQRLATAQAPALDPELGEQMRQCTPSTEDPAGIAEVLRSGQSHRFALAEGEALGGAPGTREAPLTEQKFAVALSVPLVARGRTTGAITFASSLPGRYQEPEVAFAEDLARRAALAIDNARLYRASNDAIRARDEFLSVASHELRTPLTSLQLSLERLRRDSGKETLARALDNAERQNRRLNALVEDLLDVSALQRGGPELRHEEVDLSELARHIALLFGDLLRRSGTELRIDAPAPVVGHGWDRARLAHALEHLVANALKYGPGKPIEVSVRREGGFGVISVTDHGIGISEERLPFIFERFERAVPTRHYGGLGLGLHIVRQIVQRHGGTVSVQSELGKGATFTIRLPLGPEGREG